MGRGQKPPPQFGQTFRKIFSTQGRQKVHSNEQIIASTELGGSGVLQFSQVGLSSSMIVFCCALRSRQGSATRPKQPESLNLS
jgi:hypothetical protein